VNFRPLTGEDFPSVVQLLAEDEARLFGRPSRIGLPDVTAWLAGVDLERNTWLSEEEGQAVAVGWAEVEEHHDAGFAIGVVRRDRQGRGLGSQLLALMEGRLRELGVGRMHSVTLAPDTTAPKLLVARGYREVRRFWEMTIELGEELPPAPPVLPEGLRIERFSNDSARAFHAALEEAFEDHWEHQPEAFESWWERQSARPDHDPSLWFLVRDGSEVAAATRNDPERSGGGWIGTIGVRRRWRGRGLAKALLLESFREFHRRGQRRVGLGVDSENSTGATHLYESVGMSVEQEQVVWEKELA
jgi:mycothiol synthase